MLLVVRDAARDGSVPRPPAGRAQHDRSGLVRDIGPRGGLYTARVHAAVGTDELTRLDPDSLVLSNVNTPHDYRQACSRSLNR
jgi:hypothetical protein